MQRVAYRVVCNGTMTITDAPRTSNLLESDFYFFQDQLSDRENEKVLEIRSFFERDEASNAWLARLDLATSAMPDGDWPSFDPGDWSRSDPGRLLTALGQPLDDAELDRITPWRFAAPLAPPTDMSLCLKSVNRKDEG